MNSREKKYHHENLRGELIEAGVRFIGQNGLQNLSLRKIAALCGVSHTALYKHFKNKDDMVASITAHVMKRFLEELECSQARGGADPLRDLIELGKGYVKFMVENPDYFKYLFHSGVLRCLPAELLADMDVLSDKPKAECCSMGLFQRTARRYLDSIHADPNDYPSNIFAMWAMVQGIALLFVGKNVTAPGGDYLSVAEKILSCNLRFKGGPPPGPACGRGPAPCQ